MSKTHHVVGTYEAIKAVSLFLPEYSAKSGLQHHFIKLTIAAIREKNLKMFFWSLVRLRNPLIIIERFYIFMKNYFNY